ncbi:unnamed protein product [Callosobruchus maculatus]|uniref:Thioredoxin domain-containing protein n=1 Tax=Callosobruchus maculatus TaxID=64391 RepID=A0A653BHB4_CALMS|nr:unnamed protein product [Callosobruchus maculatus]
MAKKGQAIQLQTEVATDEEWEKLLSRDGLIIVDVCSDWCGSCQGMSAHLKKIKLEVGGDMLHLAMAKSDSITPLERFRGKSEPTWMFISKGRVINLMFGANSPKLTRLILAELKKVHFTESTLEELLYFATESELNEETIADMLEPEHETLVCLLKPSRGSTVEDVHPAVLEMVYGPTLRPPGGKDSLYERLKQEEDEEGRQSELIGIWAPHTDFLYATVLRMFFPKYSAEFTIPEPEPTPPYIAMVFDQKKMHDVMHVMAQYPREIMHYGFFTSEVPSQTELVAKSVRKLDKVVDKRTFNEKMVLQVSKKKSECIFALAQLNPVYMSPNAEEGERECQIFFPENYADDLNEEDFVYEPLDAMITQEEESIEEGELMNIEGDAVDEEEESEEESEEQSGGDEELFDDMFGFD